MDNDKSEEPPNSNEAWFNQESDNILNDLSWDYSKGREFLQQEFNVSTRKDLTHDQLISFVDKLKSIKNRSK